MGRPPGFWARNLSCTTQQVADLVEYLKTS